MMLSTSLMQVPELAEYVVIGAGPAGICAIAHLWPTISPEKMVWIDPQFQVGDFGTLLSRGSSVPGNTSVKSYQHVLQGIYGSIPVCAPSKAQDFELNRLLPTATCPLKIAAEPLRCITTELRKHVPSIMGKAFNIMTCPDETLEIEVEHGNGTVQKIKARQVILATGAQAKKYKLPSSHLFAVMIDPNTAFIRTELEAYLQKNPEVKKIAVVGSSHSAALAVMHLLQAGIVVHHVMNKGYRFASQEISAAGVPYVKYDNTGLKGEVARFTRALCTENEAEYQQYNQKYKQYVGDTFSECEILLSLCLSSCTHLVAAIGYHPSETLQVNGQALSQLKHDPNSLRFLDFPGLFGVGIAFPSKVKTYDGEEEFAVGVEKFWLNFAGRFHHSEAHIFASSYPVLQKNGEAIAVQSDVR